MEVVVLGDYDEVDEESCQAVSFFGSLPESAHFVADGVEGEDDEVEHQQ